MSLNSISNGKDFYTIGIFEDHNFRFLLTDCTNTIQYNSKIHELTEIGSVFLSKVMIGSFFLSGMVKEENTVSLHIESDGKIQSTIAYSDRFGRMRGMIRESNDSERIGVGKGIFRVIRWGEEGRLHQSMTSYKDLSFEENLINHINESDQLTSFLMIQSGVQKSKKGLMLQALPFTEQYQINHLMDCINEIDESIESFLDGNEEMVIKRLTYYLKSSPKILFRGIPEFHCECSLEKIEKVILSIGKKEAFSILEEQNKIEIICDFCKKNYTLDSDNLHSLFN
jgi:molecular chaperone Hsp33